MPQPAAATLHDAAASRRPQPAAPRLLLPAAPRRLQPTAAAARSEATAAAQCCVACSAASAAARSDELAAARRDAPAAFERLLDIRTFGFFICILFVSECAPTRRLPPTSQSLAGWPRGCREIGTCAAVSMIPLGSCSDGGLAGRTAAAACCGRTRWLPQECSSPSSSRVLCCRLCLTSQKKKKQAWKEVSLHHPLSVGPAGGWPCGSGTGAVPATAAERDRCRTTAGHMYLLVGSVCSLSLSTPTSGLARRGRRRGRRRGAQLDGEFTFYASRRRLRAWPGGRCGGAHSWTEIFLSGSSP